MRSKKRIWVLVAGKDFVGKRPQKSSDVYALLLDGLILCANHSTVHFSIDLASEKYHTSKSNQARSPEHGRLLGG
jgi:hypothetical protein